MIAQYGDNIIAPGDDPVIDLRRVEDRHIPAQFREQLEHPVMLEGAEALPGNVHGATNRNIAWIKLRHLGRLQISLALRIGLNGSPAPLSAILPKGNEHNAGGHPDGLSGIAASRERHLMQLASPHQMREYMS
jgi:hypothetical protein